jgi:2-dehydropantoate 2-reductase
MGPYQPSTLVDWLAGNELEIEPIWGEPLRQAQQAGLAMPHLERLYGSLRVISGR